MQRYDALAMMYPLTDAAQFSLWLCQERKDQPYFIRGHGEVALPLSPERELQFKCKVLSSGIFPMVSYILVETMGDLWFLLSYDKAIKEVGFTLIDKSKVNKVKVKNMLEYKAIFDLLMPGVMGMWMRAIDNVTWSRLDAIGDMDGAVANAEEVRGSDHRVSTGGTSGCGRY